MDIEKMLAALREERELVDGAILALERLARGTGKRRGRPPKWLLVTNAAEAGAQDPPRKRRFSPEARKRMAEAQKRRWAAARKQQEG